VGGKALPQEGHSGEHFFLLDGAGSRGKARIWRESEKSLLSVGGKKGEKLGTEAAG